MTFIILCVEDVYQKLIAIMGSLANIKPLLWIDPSGKLVPLTKVRGRKKP